MDVPCVEKSMRVRIPPRILFLSRSSSVGIVHTRYGDAVQASIVHTRYGDAVQASIVHTRYGDVSRPVSYILDMAMLSRPVSYILDMAMPPRPVSYILDIAMPSWPVSYVLDMTMLSMPVSYILDMAMPPRPVSYIFGDADRENIDHGFDFEHDQLSKFVIMSYLKLTITFDRCLLLHTAASDLYHQHFWTSSLHWASGLCCRGCDPMEQFHIDWFRCPPQGDELGSGIGRPFSAGLWRHRGLLIQVTQYMQDGVTDPGNDRASPITKLIDRLPHRDLIGWKQALPGSIFSWARGPGYSFIHLAEWYGDVIIGSVGRLKWMHSGESSLNEIKTL
jgi:hypothetical protein